MAVLPRRRAPDLIPIDQRRPLPEGRWVMAQSWHDLLFAHWPVPVEALRSRLPAPLTPDIREGETWLGVVPFRMSGVRLRGLPAVPWLSAFPELNVRTYVTVGGKPGVYFFSLDAANTLAVAVGRAWFHLPYQRAWMRARPKARPCATRAAARSAAPTPAELRASYRAIGPVSRAERGSLAHWLTERYCLYSVDRNGRVWRGEIHHAPWPLQPAEASFERLEMVEALGLRLAGAPTSLRAPTRRPDLAAPTGHAGGASGHHTRAGVGE